MHEFVEMSVELLMYENAIASAPVPEWVPVDPADVICRQEEAFWALVFKEGE